MTVKYEFKRAFSRAFIIALTIGVLSGIFGLVAYYYDSRWNEFSEISCYDAWLYCLSVSEGSIYRVVFPIIICLPYLPTFYYDRKSNFLLNVTSRMPYSRYLIIKVGVGLISAMTVVFLTLGIWLGVCFALFPQNLPITEFNYVPKGVFSSCFVLHPMRYISKIILLNLITGALFYLFSMAISHVVNSKQLVIIAPFAIYLILILISQIKTFSMLNPVALVAPLEVSSFTLNQIVFQWAIIMLLSCTSIAFFYRKDKREIL